MSSLRWYVASFVVIAAALVGGAFMIERVTIDELLYDDAVATARDWTGYLAANLADLPAIAAGEAPSAASQKFLDQGRKLGQIFLFKIYDAEGRVRYSSDTLPMGSNEDEDLSEHNAEAAEAIANGQPAIEAKTGEPPGRPAFFAEAYVPHIVNGKVQAVVEAYIDQTAKRASFQSAFTIATSALCLLMAAAFGIPAGAWYLRAREKQKADARIHFLANYDSLTGLANRIQLGKRLERALSAPGRTGQLAVHCIDLDGFKDINDALGHDAGDLVIQAVGERLRMVAGPNDIVARLGSDDFAVVQMQARDRLGAEAFARQLLDQIKEPCRLNGQEVKLGARIGIALAPEHGTDAGRLMKSADLALAKKGGARFRIFSSDLDAELYQRLSIEKAISQAIEAGSFAVHYQAQFSLNTGRLVGFEALIRLPTPDGGLIPPTIFIPIAEKMGVIDRIGSWVMTQACTVAASWPEQIKVAVNMSPAQFATGDVGLMMARALKASGLAPGRLEIEITESLLLHDTDAILRELTSLKALGISIVMDDFGTGYSSLSYLWRFPFDKIKVDRSFMTAFEAGDSSVRQIIRTIVTLGRSLNMRVTVEGVETERQALFASEIGCDDVQGFYFGRPAPTTEIARIVMADFQAGQGVQAEPRQAVAG